MTGQSANITDGMGGAATIVGATTLPNTTGDSLLTLLSGITLAAGVIVMASFVMTRIAVYRNK